VACWWHVGGLLVACWWLVGCVWCSAIRGMAISVYLLVFSMNREREVLLGYFHRLEVPMRISRDPGEVVCMSLRCT
jgi:hypothetical protein